MASPELIAAARGDRPADLLFPGGRIANLFTAEGERAERVLALGTG